MDDLELSNEELESPLWKKMEAFLENELAKARKLNDHELGHHETCHLRGVIYSLKKLLSLNPKNEDV